MLNDDLLVSDVRPPLTFPGIATLWRPSLVVACVYLGLIGYLAIARGYRAFDYVHLGTVWSSHQRSGDWGYDGQFYYQIASHPLGASAYMDNAPYRYQHILYGLLAWLLSLGQTAFVPYALLALNSVAIVLSVELLARLLERSGASPWYSLALGLYFGQAAAFSFDTAEPLTYGLVCAGFWLLESKRVPWAALLLGLAALSRETAVVCALVFAGHAFWRGSLRDVAWFLGLGTLPLLLWLLTLALIFKRSGLTFTPPFEQLPFAGIFAYMHTPKKFWLLVCLLLLPTLAGWIALGADLVRRRVGVVSFIWLVNLLLVTFLSRHSYVDLISCGRLTIGLVLTCLLYGLYMRNRSVLLGAQFYAGTLLVFVVGIGFHIDSFLQ